MFCSNRLKHDECSLNRKCSFCKIEGICKDWPIGRRNKKLLVCQGCRVLYSHKPPEDGDEKVCSHCQKNKPLNLYAYSRSKCNSCVNEQKRLKQTSESRRIKHLRDKYDMTVQEFELKLVNQEGKCKICKLESKKRLHVDHSHVTGRVRGLLCSNCNTGLGLFQDSAKTMESAIEYLKEYETPTPLNAFTVMMEAAKKMKSQTTPLPPSPKTPPLPPSPI